MPRPLGLHQLTAMDVGPLELIEIAASCGYNHVSLFTNAPVVPIAGQEGKFQFPTVTPDLKGEVLARLDACGLDVINAEFFLMRPDVDLETCRSGLALARELGAKNAMTHIFEADSARAADILGLGPLLERYPRQLSGGQRQRVAMGRAIVRDPQVFLFDEPLSNLDAKLRVAMRTEIKELHQRLKTTTVYVTHDQVEAMTMADRIVVMHDGRIEQIGAPLELYDHPDNLFVAQFIGSPSMNVVNGTLRRSNGSSYVEVAGGGRWPLASAARAPKKAVWRPAQAACSPASLPKMNSLGVRSSRRPATASVVGAPAPVLGITTVSTPSRRSAVMASGTIGCANRTAPPLEMSHLRSYSRENDDKSCRHLDRPDEW